MFADMEEKTMPYATPTGVFSFSSPLLLLFYFEIVEGTLCRCRRFLAPRTSTYRGGGGGRRETSSRNSILTSYQSPSSSQYDKNTATPVSAQQR